VSPFQGLKWCGFIFTGLCPVLMYFAPSGLKLTPFPSPFENLKKREAI